MDQKEFEIEGSVLVTYAGTDAVVTVPQGVEIIGENAFYENAQIRKAILPEGVREIRKSAFKDCHGLEEVELPESLEFLDEDAFAFSGLLALRIPSRITVLPPFLAFACQNLRSVRLPEGVTTIGNWAFRHCNELREINLPASLRSFGAHLFEGCQNLRMRLTPGVVPPFPELLRSLRPAFLDAPGVSILALPSETRHAVARSLAEQEVLGRVLPPELEADLVTYLSAEWPALLSEAISNPSLLRLLLRRNVIPREGVDVLLRRMALGEPQSPEIPALLLDALKRLPEPDSAEREKELLRELETGFLSAAAFDASWTARPGKAGLTLVEYHGADSDIFVPAGRGNVPVVSLASTVFEGRTDIRSVTIPEGVRSLGPRSFSHCESLQSVELPSTLEIVPRECFHSCKSLTRVRLEPGLKAISKEAFRDCARLEEIRLPASLERLGKRTFSTCRSLKRVDMPPRLERIPGLCFEDCESLEHIRIPPGTESVGQHAFRGCSHLEEAVLPEGGKGHQRVRLFQMYPPGPRLPPRIPGGT